MKKQNLGQFNTTKDVWLRPHILEFIENSSCDTIVDPFAGQGDLLDLFSDYSVVGYDIDPTMGWEENDSLVDIPKWDNAMVVTNPPYLAKNSANRNNFESYKYFEDSDCEDLYQIAIYRVLAKYDKAVFIIPETYFQSEVLIGYLYSYTVIEENPFEDTDCPICVAAFHATNDFGAIISGNNYKIYKNDEHLFDRFELEDMLRDFNSLKWLDITFNDPAGNLGLRGVDGVDPNNQIKFCKPEELNYDLSAVGNTSRAITVLNVGCKITDEYINHANFLLGELRNRTDDVVLSPFKNNNKAGRRRRRLDFKWARKILEKTAEDLDK